jgi:hypothetical protein
MTYVTFRCDQNTLILNEIFMLGKRGVTITVCQNHNDPL